MSDSTDGRGSVHPLGEIAEELTERLRRGERPEISEYVDRYPDLAEQIRKLLPALLLVEKVGAHEGAASNDVPVEAAAATAPVREIGDYLIHAEIGRGGMGIVYEATQKSLGRRVALKVLPLNTLLKPSHLERFRREAQAAARLRHANIVPVFDVGETDGVHYYAMQLVRGQGLDAILEELRRQRDPHTLASNGSCVEAESQTETVYVTQRLLGGPAGDSINARGMEQRTDSDSRAKDHEPRVGDGDSFGTRGSESETSSLTDSELFSSESGGDFFRNVAGLGLQAAEALAHAHADGVMHRDIKPSNLMLDVDGTLWVTDFGLAKMEGSESLTGAGDVLGTVPYMAPERLEGWSDARSDVFSLGLTLYELLTLRRAFDGTDRHVLLKQVVEIDPPKPSRLDGTIPRDLETIVLKTIEKEPRKRYQSAAQLADDLRSFLERRPIKARRVTAVDRFRLWARRNPWLATASLGLFISLVVGFTVALSLLRTARLERDRAQTLLARQQAEKGLGALKNDSRHALLDLLDARRTADGNPELRDSLLRLWSGWEQALKSRLLFRREHGVARGFTSGDTVTISPDGGLLALRSSTTTVLMCSAWTGRDHGKPMSHNSNVDWIKFSPDRTLLATATVDGRVRFWSTADGSESGAALKPSATKIRTLGFSYDGSLLFTAFADTVTVWNVESRKLQCPALVVDGTIVGVAFNHDGSLLETMLLDRTSTIWKTSTGEPLPWSTDHPSWQTNAVFDGDGDLLHPLPGVERSSGRKQFPDFRRLLIWNREHVTVWDHTREPLPQVTFPQASPVRAVAFERGGGVIAVGSDSGVVLRNRETGEKEAMTFDTTGAVVGIAFGDNGRRLAAVSADGMVYNWNAETGELVVPPWKSDSMNVSHAVFGADATLVVTQRQRNGLMSGRGARSWDALTGEPRGEYFTGSQAVSLTADGKTMAAGGRVRTILQSPATGERLPGRIRSGKNAFGYAFNSDGSVLAVASGDSTDLFDVTTGERVGETLSNSSKVRRLAFSPDDRTLATAEGRFVRLWQVEMGPASLGLSLPHGSDVHALAFSPDGAILATGSSEDGGGALRLWRLAKPPTSLRETELRTWTTVGVRYDAAGQVEAIQWDEIESYQDELDSIWAREPNEIEQLRLRERVSRTESEVARDLERSEDWPAAIRHLDRAIHGIPDDWALHARRCRAFLSTGRWAEARLDHGRVLDLLAFRPGAFRELVDSRPAPLLTFTKIDFGRLSPTGEPEKRDPFDGRLALDWRVEGHHDRSHVSLSKKPGTLTITTQAGGFAKQDRNRKNVYLIPNPLSNGEDFEITTCLVDFDPTERTQQAGLVCFDDEDSWVKACCEFHQYGGRVYHLRRRSRQVRGVGAQNILARPKRVWLRLVKSGDRYSLWTSSDGRSFQLRGALRWQRNPKEVGILALNGEGSNAAEIDASFEFFEVRKLVSPSDR